MLFEDRVLVDGNPLDSPEFQHWFAGSKIVLPDGQPRIVFHETESKNVESIDQNGFDVSRIHARGTDEVMPDGIFFKPTRDSIFPKNPERPTNNLPFVLAIKNPLRVRDRDHLAAVFRRDRVYAALAERVNKFDKRIADAAERLMSQNDSTGRVSIAGIEAAKRLLDRSAKINDMMAARARRRATQLLRQQGYDGVIMDQDRGGLFNKRVVTTFVALDSSQVRRVRYLWD